MNQICHMVEKKLAEIDTATRKKQFQKEQFLRRFCTDMVNERTSLYQDVKAELKEQERQLKYIIAHIRKSGGDSGTYDYHYHEARRALLARGTYKPEEKVVNIMIILAYADPETAGDMSKSILWNSFEDEMIERAARKEYHDIDLSVLERLSKSRKNKQPTKKEPVETELCDDSIHFPYELKTAISTEVRAGKLVGDKKMEKRRAADLRRLMVALLVLQKREDGEYEPLASGEKASSKPIGLPSDSELTRLAGFKSYQRKQIGEMLLDLKQLGQFEVAKGNKIKVKHSLDFPEGKNVLDEKTARSKDNGEICKKVIKEFSW